MPNDLRAIGRWLGAEARLLLGAAAAPGLWALLAAALLLWSLAYQAPAGHTLHIGGDPATRLRWYDGPFLDGFNEPEPARRDGREWYELPAPPYRWSEDRAEVLLPGMGGGAWQLTLRAASGRPDGAPAQSAWRLGESAPVSVTVAAAPRVYRLLGPASGGDVRLRMETAALPTQGDPRTLGVVLFRLDASTTRDAPRAPAPGALALLCAALGGLWALAQRVLAAHSGVRAHASAAATSAPPAGIGRGQVLVLGALAAVALAGAYLLAVRRADVTVFAPALAALVWACYLVQALLGPLLAAAAHRLVAAAAPGEVAAAALASAASFGLRMGGMLHPYARFSDTGLHVNNLLGVALRGAVLITEGLPCEAGGGESPYAAGPYLALAPGALVTGADRQLQTLLVQGGTALLESSSAGLVWLLLRASGLGRRAALAGAALYAFAPPLLRSYSVGEMANLFAQGLLLPLLLFLALAAPAARRPKAAALGGALLALALLSHTGFSISTAALLAAWVPLLALGRAAAGERPVGWLPWRLLLAGGGAVALVGLVFYSAYLGLFEERRLLAEAQAALPPDARCPVGYPLAQKLWGWGPGQVFHTHPALAGPLLAAGGAGAALLLLGGARRRALGLALAASWAGAVLSLGTLLTSDQAVRWQPYLFPALCLGAGAALAAWGRRGRAGALLAAASAAYLAWYAAADWVNQIADYLH